MTSEAQELLKLIDAHMKAMYFVTDSDSSYGAGMRCIRWLVFNFYNAPRPITEPKPLTEEELKMLTPEEE